tara:strand:+ start:599 stop:814 length:216 start_codon:yes stop_codon:yes gene_type:complete
MLITFKKLLFIISFNFSLFIILMIGIQNSSNRNQVNFIIGETVRLPLSFIIGISFISGSISGSFLTINLKK